MFCFVSPQVSFPIFSHLFPTSFYFFLHFLCEFFVSALPEACGASTEEARWPFHSPQSWASTSPRAIPAGGGHGHILSQHLTMIRLNAQWRKFSPQPLSHSGRVTEWLSGSSSHSGRVAEWLLQPLWAEWLSGCSSYSGRVAEWLSGCSSHSGRVAEWLLQPLWQSG